MDDQLDPWLLNEQDLDTLTEDYWKLFDESLHPECFNDVDYTAFRCSSTVNEDLTVASQWTSGPSTNAQTSALCLERVAGHTTDASLIEPYYLDTTVSKDTGVLDSHEEFQHGRTSASHQYTLSILPDHHEPVTSNTTVFDNDPVDLIVCEIPQPNPVDAAKFQAQSQPSEPRSRIPERAKRYLEAIFGRKPYPTTTERDEIAKSTGLTAKRVKNWFSNARARKPTPDEEVVHANPKEHIVRARLSQESLEKLNKENEAMDEYSVINAYISDSAEDEDLITAFHQAAQLRKLEKRKNGAVSSSFVQRAHRPRSVASSRASSGGSTQSQNSVTSIRSNASCVSRTRRRGRKRFMNIDTTEKAPEPVHRKVYNSFACTFCWKRFRNKYEWLRHEESVHVTRRSWVCCSIDYERDGVPSCPFCELCHDLPFANEDCDFHRYLACKRKPDSERTFYRKDQFIQHLKMAHHIQEVTEEARDTRSMTLRDQLAIAWCREEPALPASNPALHCGFCGKWSSDWIKRSDHVTEHFRNGNDNAAAWWPDRQDTTCPNIRKLKGVDNFECDGCFQRFTHPSEHWPLRIWSCRFIDDEDALFEDPDGFCKLCGHWLPEICTERVGHADRHRYRSCEQAMFVSFEEFVSHLRDFHDGSVDYACTGNNGLLNFSSLMTWCRSSATTPS